ncbi:MAG TPA: hypothetical protein VE954_43360 [Oligoflexus sp.]|uniref:hypothetical protein n=1 Tax=Oligoflexus sp. TaxID=1971216 RepID=UPI002D295728|nr:hypothetical protein [Oligoflexus sp.]HYX39984.1 hypothetical protein [Oligoflexus sp.]
MNVLISALEETAGYLQDAGRHDLVLSVAEAIQKIRQAEEMALSIVAADSVAFDVWKAMKAYRRAGTMPEAQRSTPA